MENAQRLPSNDDANEESSWSNAGKLCGKVRELAHRSYHALYLCSKSDDRDEADSPDIAEDLRDLRDQVARLQEKIHARGLGAMIPWVDALRRQVEDGLGDARQGV